MNVINVLLPGSPVINSGEELAKQPDQIRSSLNEFRANTTSDYFKTLSHALRLFNQREAFVGRNQTFEPITKNEDVFAFVRRQAVFGGTAYVIAADMRQSGGAVVRDLSTADLSGDVIVDLEWGGHHDQGSTVKLENVETVPGGVLVLRVGDIDRLEGIVPGKTEDTC